MAVIFIEECLEYQLVLAITKSNGLYSYYILSPPHFHFPPSNHSPLFRQRFSSATHYVCYRLSALESISILINPCSVNAGIHIGSGISYGHPPINRLNRQDCSLCCSIQNIFGEKKKLWRNEMF